MFYGQCNACGERWELGTASTCKCPKPDRWVGLTDEEIEDEWERLTGHNIFGGDRSAGRTMFLSPDEVIHYTQAIEAKLKERNHAG
jgi:hypothetical protein